ncbi:MAG: riboflavin synthase [Bacilli bacterium]
MFSGIIEEIGTIKNIEPLTDGFRYTVAARKVLKGTKLGDSIAHDGICLTVVKKGFHQYQVEVMKETIDVTALRLWKIGSGINLERALAANQRNGGHQVAGHVDGIGLIKKFTEEGIATVLTIEVPQALTRYMIQKGSVAMDGISLTLTEVTNTTFTVWLIPHTKTHTTLLRKKLGDPVNIEVDMLAKYVEKLNQK